jgi:hypothetical protein
MLGSNLSACQVLKKGGLGQQMCCLSLFLLPFGETKAVNPGGLGAEPPCAPKKIK